MLPRTLRTSEGSSGAWSSIPKQAQGDCVGLIARREQRAQDRPLRIDKVKLHLTKMLPIAMRPFTFCQSLALLLALAVSARAEARTETFDTPDHR